MAGFDDPAIFIEQRRGVVETQANGDLLLQGTSVPWAAAILGAQTAQVRIFNNSPDMFLVFTEFKQDPSGLIARTKVKDHKVNPGKAGTITSHGEFPVYHTYLGAVKWVTPDPNPGDPGGKTAAELAWQNVTDWFQNNAWILVALIILIVMIVIIYLYLRRNIL